MCLLDELIFPLFIGEADVSVVRGLSCPKIYPKSFLFICIDRYPHVPPLPINGVLNGGQKLGKG